MTREFFASLHCGDMMVSKTGHNCGHEVIVVVLSVDETRIAYQVKTLKKDATNLLLLPTSKCPMACMDTLCHGWEMMDSTGSE